MKKSSMYVSGFLLTAAFITQSCKKDTLQEPQPLKSAVSVQQNVKLAGESSGVTKISPPAVTTPFLLPWTKVTDPPPQPYTFMDPSPEPYKGN